MTKFARSLCAAALSLWAALPATAQFLTADDVVDVSLMPGYRMGEDRHMAAIRIDLAAGWHTYWRSPGEGGVPTVLRLTRVEGINGMALHWPTPDVFVTNGLRSIGYEGSVIIPVEFALGTDGAAMLEGRLEMGVCLDVCMPISIDLAAVLPPVTDRDGTIIGALSDRPFTAAEAGAGAVTCSVEPIHDGLRVTVRAQVPPVGNDETVVVEHRDPSIWVSEAATSREGSWVTARADVVPADHGPFAMNRQDLLITVIGSRMAVELDRCTG